MLYRLSKLVPVRFRTTYRNVGTIKAGRPGDRVRCTWWQWRGRHWRVRRQVIEAGPTS